MIHTKETEMHDPLKHHHEITLDPEDLTEEELVRIASGESPMKVVLETRRPKSIIGEIELPVRMKLDTEALRRDLEEVFTGAIKTFEAEIRKRIGS